MRLYLAVLYSQVSTADSQRFYSLTNSGFWCTRYTVRQMKPKKLYLSWASCQPSQHCLSYRFKDVSNHAQTFQLIHTP
uniref:Uncharacterized protein n=1 Tax=Triticum urartu TaxID=4572 RepID=A0A8R7R0S3_TRIUA